MPGNRVWLDVPYSEKDAAKAAGARWDQSARRWYAPRPGMAELDAWQAAAPVPDLLPNEDRSLGSGLYVDLVPSSCWFTNVRSCVSQRDWERLRRMITSRAGFCCEICAVAEDREQRRWLEAHERWTYDQGAQVQALRRLICLCTDCHTVTHFGLATVRGVEAQAFAHLVAVTRMNPTQARAHVAEGFRTWQARSKITWSLDLSMLTDAGINVAPPPDARQRAAAAEPSGRAAERPAR